MIFIRFNIFLLLLISFDIRFRFLIAYVENRHFFNTMITFFNNNIYLI